MLQTIVSHCCGVRSRGYNAPNVQLPLAAKLYVGSEDVFKVHEWYGPHL